MPAIDERPSLAHHHAADPRPPRHNGGWPAHARDPALARDDASVLRRHPLAWRAGGQRLPDAQTLFCAETGNPHGLAGSDVHALGPLSGQALLRLGSLADIDTVMAQGFEAWLAAQFAQAHCDSGHPYVDFAAYRQLLSAPDGLRRRLQLMLTEYVVVSPASTSPPWPHRTYATFWDGLGDHAFGNFRDLLEFVTLRASMGAFLNTAGNQKEDPSTGRVPDENEPARVFTGYQIDDSGPRITPLVGGGWRPTHALRARTARHAARALPGHHHRGRNTRAAGAGDGAGHLVPASQRLFLGRLREPALRLLQWGRSFGLVSKSGSWKRGFDVESPELFHGQRGATAPEFQISTRAGRARSRASAT